MLLPSLTNLHHTTLSACQIVQHGGSGARSRCFINGASTSLRVLRELGCLLVDANGQHSSNSLKDQGTQLDLLDRIAGVARLARRLAVGVRCVGWGWGGGA